MLSEKYLWVSVEGTDGVGKSTLIREIAQSLQSTQPHVRILVLNEFSRSPIGEVIQKIIDTHRFFILGNTPHRVAETLVLCADYAYQIEEIAQEHSDQRTLLISDRGPYSFLTYQKLRLEKAYSTRSPDEIENWIRMLFLLIGYPYINILLTSPSDHIQQRLANREGAANEEELRFIMQVQETYAEMFRKEQQTGKPHMLILESLNGQFDQVIQTSLHTLHGALRSAGWIS